MNMKKGIMRFCSLMLAGVMLLACGKEKENIIGSDAGKVQKTQEVKLVDIPLTQEHYGIGVNSDKKDLLKQVNQYIERIKSDGTMDEINSHYFDDGEPVRIESAELDPKRDQLVVSSTLDFEPFEFGEVGEYYGIDMEIAAGLADYLGKDLVIVNSNFETMLMSIRQKKCDICIGGITITKERAKFMDFSDPYYTVSQNLLVKGDNKEFDSIKDPKELLSIFKAKGMDATVGVENMTTAQQFAEGDEKSGYEGMGVKVNLYKNNMMAAQALVDGEVDYVLLDSVNGQFVEKAMNGDK